MAGKFINHNFTNTVDVINDTMVNRVKNANYMLIIYLLLLQSLGIILTIDLLH
jgi:hypothetical protein